MFLPHPRVKLSIVGSLRDREVACLDRQGSNSESCVWKTVSSHSSNHPQEALLAQFSLYVHKRGLKPDSFHFISLSKIRNMRKTDKWGFLHTYYVDTAKQNAKLECKSLVKSQLTGKKCVFRHHHLHMIFYHKLNKYNSFSPTWSCGSSYAPSTCSPGMHLYMYVCIFMHIFCGSYEINYCLLSIVHCQVAENVKFNVALQLC